MIVPVFDHPEAVQRFVAAGLFSPGRVFGDATAIGFANATDGLLAGFVYHNYEPDTGVIEVSAYSTCRSWTNRERLQLIFDYPFEQLGCRLLVARHSEHNTRARRIWQSIGAVECRLPQLRADDEDEMLAVLHADSWRNSKFKR